MGREAKLRQKNGHWYSEAGGVPRYYGKIGEVAFREATKRLRVTLTEVVAVPRGITVKELVGGFTKWLDENRAPRTAYERARLLESWVELHGESRAVTIAEPHLADYQAGLRTAGFHVDYIKRHVMTVRMLYRYGVRYKLLPTGFDPFAHVEQLRSPVKVPTEASLLKADEISRLFQHADTDLGTPGFRRFSQEARVGDGNPWSGFLMMLKVYHATGARTHELAMARVTDFSTRARQIILPVHKRSLTLKENQARIIYLNDSAYTIVEACCKDRAGDAPIFTRPLHEKQRLKDQPWYTERLNWRFRLVRELAGVRDSITIYSFRHLWISEMLMAGVDILLVARMAGTSVMMIEKVYGHFRSQSFQDAQAKLDFSRRKFS